MQTRWLEEKLKYDGTQLRPLFGYLEHGLMGDSVVAWLGACDVNFQHMVDGEDLLVRSEIRGEEMLHFIFEIFDQPLSVGVYLQRLFAAQIKDLIEGMGSVGGGALERQGDDLFFRGGKLSISIATRAVNSVLIHFAVNITNRGTPVKTACLEELAIDPKVLATRALALVSREYLDIKMATYKVKTV